jgi:hypothetical protein
MPSKNGFNSCSQEASLRAPLELHVYYNNRLHWMLHVTTAVVGYVAMTVVTTSVDDPVVDVAESTSTSVEV